MTPKETAIRLKETFGDLAIKVVDEIIQTRPNRSPMTSDSIRSMNYWKFVKYELERNDTLRRAS